jgi:hypothetical protein
MAVKLLSLVTGSPIGVISVAGTPLVFAIRWFSYPPGNQWRIQFVWST